MNELLEKLKRIVLELEQERGPILVFGFFLREDPFEIWDILIAAPWTAPGDIESGRLIGTKIQDTLTREEKSKISRFVVLDVNDPATLFLQENFSVTNGGFEEISSAKLTDRFGFSIKRAYLLRCRK